MSARQFRSVLFLVFVTSALGAACASDTSDPGGGNGGGGGGGGTTADVAGTWQWAVTNITSSCGPETGWNAQVEIVQSGTSATATSAWRSNGGEHSSTNGTVTGDDLTFDITYPEEDGQLTATHSVTVDSDGNTMTGSETWSWTNGTTTCSSGTADVTATKQ